MALAVRECECGCRADEWVEVACHSASELACRDNEMGYMFYHDLGGISRQDKTGTQTALGGQALTGIQMEYWSGTEFDRTMAWGFNFSFGDVQFTAEKVHSLTAWAVRDGDVVPEPSSVLLIGVGMLGLACIRALSRCRADRRKGSPQLRRVDPSPATQSFI